MSQMASLNCFNCSQQIEVMIPVPRKEDCDHCGADIHCCYNCKFHDKTAYNECVEPSAEVVRDKDRSNFCDFFEPGSGKGAGNKKEDLLAAAEALFKKK